jgi:poly(ADP-ribose) glycohydrolase ARH3
MPELTIEERAVGVLLGTFVGDALGMPFEGRGADVIPERVEMVDGRAPAGTYTDDTQMMIALAESLVRMGRLDGDDLARTFLNAYDPARGYGGGTEEVLKMWRGGVPVSEASGRVRGGDGSPNDGAAMRVAPVAVAFFAEGEDAVARQAEGSARITHAHVEAVDGAVVQAVAVAAGLGGRPPLERARAVARTAPMRTRLSELAAAGVRADGEALDPGRFAGVDGRVGFTAVEAVPPAVVIGATARSFEEAVTVAVRCGGDTDTVAAMAGATAGARFGAGAIPARWLDALEDGDRGRSHVEELARQLTDSRRGA